MNMLGSKLDRNDKNKAKTNSKVHIENGKINNKQTLEARNKSQMVAPP
jgi:hypothetical protein